MEHGKAVLCEKPMAINEQQARAMADCARKNDVFLMEAMWTRFLPVIKEVKSWVNDGKIGDPAILTADFGYMYGGDPEGRANNLALGGGGLLDIGVYPVALAAMVFGSPPAEITAAAQMMETGADAQTGMIFRYEAGGMAILYSTLKAGTLGDAGIFGTKGSIKVPVFWNAESATLQVDNEEPVQISRESGYHYEAAEVMSCLTAGKKESADMPLDESIAIMRTMDEVRAIIGLSYPME